MIGDVASVIRLNQLILAGQLRREDVPPDVPVQRLNAVVLVGMEVSEVDRRRCERLARSDHAQGRVCGIGPDLKTDASIVHRRHPARASRAAIKIALLDRYLEAPVPAPGKLDDERFAVGLIAQPECWPTVARAPAPSFDHFGPGTKRLPGEVSLLESA